MFAYAHLLMACAGGFLLLAATNATPAWASTTIIVCKGCVIVLDPDECLGCIVVSDPPALTETCRGCTWADTVGRRPRSIRAAPASLGRTSGETTAHETAPDDTSSADSRFYGPFAFGPRADAWQAAAAPAIVLAALAVPSGDGISDDGSPDLGPFADSPYAGARPAVAAALAAMRLDRDIARERRCLATAIYFEARGEPASGQRAVAQVVLNRVSDRRYPATVCDVVFQNQERQNRCQFSFACDGRPEDIGDQRAWRRAMLLAGEALMGRYFDGAIGAATHYHATSVEPTWSRHLYRIARIGAHVFYQTGQRLQQTH
ncbi:cell wall hydrolase [Microbaculum marinisediminis]|uniref:Cell wall hydrolase n=1 Tax=Microbaculum marinisediminis TaxID=2931392 RepID=A0AAW5R026_9HYPH|nr:cell wall hydrolase [Microbaculum sp. A6E488]MCT8972509.1 cell wall hydrolase [Microbaculum sp. A6E488]